MSPKNGTNSTYLSIPLNDLVSTFSSDFQNDVSNIDWSILANSTPALQTQYNLWLGQAGVTAGAHYDGRLNFFYQLIGKKTFLLASPKHYLKMIPHSKYHIADRQSQMKPRELHGIVSKHPSSFLKTTVNEHSLLVIPHGWWHQVRSETTALSLNIWSVIENESKSWRNRYMESNATTLTNVLDASEHHGTMVMIYLHRIVQRHMERKRAKKRGSDVENRSTAPVVTASSVWQKYVLDPKYRSSKEMKIYFGCNNGVESNVLDELNESNGMKQNNVSDLICPKPQDIYHLPQSILRAVLNVSNQHALDLGLPKKRLTYDMQMSLEMESMVAEIISAFLARKQGQESQTGKEGGDRGGEGEESVLGKKKTVASTFQSELMCGFVEKCLENDVLHDEWKKHIYIHSS